jgi:nuclear transcription factor Y gamma
MEKERVEVRTRSRPPLPASQQRAVDEFWRRRQEEIEATVDFKCRMLPMARLKKVIRGATEEEEDDGMMISADTPPFLSKVCELFVQELAVRAWACAQSHNRRIILDSDIAEAVASTEYYDFLIPVLLEHLHEVAQGARAAPPATATVVTRKRHRPDRPRRAGQRIPPRALPVTPAPPAPPSSVRYMPYPFPRVLQEAAPPSEDELMLPAPPMNYTTRGGVFFRNDGNGSGETFQGENSPDQMVRSSPLAGSAGELQHSAPPAPYYFYSYPLMDNSDEAIAAGNTEITAGNADANGDGALGIPDGVHRESVVVQQISDVQDAAAGGFGGTGDESPTYMLLEEVLLDEDLLFPDADMFPAPPDSEDFVIDQDVLDDVFADPSSSTSSN